MKSLAAMEHGVGSVMGCWGFVGACAHRVPLLSAEIICHRHQLLSMAQLVPHTDCGSSAATAHTRNDA